MVRWRVARPAREGSGSHAHYLQDRIVCGEVRHINQFKF